MQTKDLYEKHHSQKKERKYSIVIGSKLILQYLTFHAYYTDTGVHKYIYIYIYIYIYTYKLPKLLGFVLAYLSEAVPTITQIIINYNNLYIHPTSVIRTLPVF